MSRLTGKNESICDYCEYDSGKGGCYSEPSKCVPLKTWNKLKHYEDLEEQGRLIELPCKVGDSVYVIRYGEEEPFIICEMKIAYFKWYEWGWFFAPNEPIPAFRTKNFGETVFLTREEAEKALAELKGTEE